jgi:hypothetical protein
LSHFLAFFSVLLSLNPNAGNQNKNPRYLKEKTEKLGGFCFFFFFFLEGDMGEKDDGLGLGLGLGLSLGLGCGGNLQTSLNMNPIHRPQPSQMVQNLDKRSTPWNEMFQFPGKLSVFALMRCFSFSKLRI